MSQKVQEISIGTKLTKKQETQIEKIQKMFTEWLHNMLGRIRFSAD